jgi:hypothetical protein
MGLLNSLFGKDEVDRLKNQLLEKSDEISLKESIRLDLEKVKLSLESTLAEKDRAIAEHIYARELLTQKLDQQTKDFEESKKSAIEQLAKLAEVNSELQKTLDRFSLEHASVKSELDIKMSEILRLRKNYEEKDRTYLERENKLSEKSEKLQLERKEFQQLEADLRNRERHWNTSIEPKLSSYQEHVTLDVRKKQLDAYQTQLETLEQNLNDRQTDMIRRQCSDDELKVRKAEITEWNRLLNERVIEVDGKEAELNQRQTELDTQELEITVIRDRAANLHEEAIRVSALTKKIKIKEDIKQALQAETKTELRQQRAELRRITKELNLREIELKEREKSIHREEGEMLTLKNKNNEFRKEVKRLNILLNQCEKEKHEESSDKDLLLIENEILNSKIASLNQVASKRQELGSKYKTSEIEIDVYDPVKHGGEIAPPPPAFRSNTPLTALHYHVGLSGIEEEEERHELLRKIISCSYRQLPKVGAPEYMRQWGEGKSPQRVRCIAYHLSWNIGFQGAKDTNELARQHWLDDLKWLTKYYKAKIPKSRWPKVPAA